MKKDKILLFGHTGQVGFQLAKELYAREDLGELYIPRKLNFVHDSESIRACIEKVRPAVIFNAAAYTDVEKAEDDADNCFKVNAYAVKEMAEAAKSVGAILVYYSTDYVFSDTKHSPYRTYDRPTVPLNVYGSSKLLGEKFIEDSGCYYIILRTSWVYSSRRKNFLLTMIKAMKASNTEPIQIVADQVGSPTSANEIARQSVAMLDSVKGKYHHLVQKSDTYHLACREHTTWFHFAEEIRNQLGGELRPLDAIHSDDFTCKAQRPWNSCLNCDGFEDAFKTKIKTWQEALKEVMGELSDVPIDKQKVEA